MTPNSQDAKMFEFNNYPRIFINLMYQENVVILIIVGAWLLILTALFIWFFLFFRRLVKGAEESDLKRVLEKILSVQDKNSEALAQVKREIGRLDEEGKFHVQKIGLVRFNPFSEIGGEHSFSVAILDGKLSGVVMTGLHTRERTRIYLKEIKTGKSLIELSEEESKALNKAIKS